MGIWARKVVVRLMGIDAPEIRAVSEAEKAKGVAARNALASVILGQNIVIETYKDRTGKYGRYLAIVWLGDQNINESMLRAGLAAAC